MENVENDSLELKAKLWRQMKNNGVEWASVVKRTKSLTQPYDQRVNKEVCLAF
jgi:hypothetical protein